MNEKTLKILEFNKIIDKLVSLATSSLGKELAEKLVPDTDLNRVERAQKETSDAVAFIARRGTPPMGGIHDIRDSLKRVEIGAILNPGELLKLPTF